MEEVRNPIITDDQHQCPHRLSTEHYEHFVHLPTHGSLNAGIFNYIVDLLQDIKIEVKSLKNLLPQQGRPIIRTTNNSSLSCLTPRINMVKYSTLEKNTIHIDDVDKIYYEVFLHLQEKELTGKIDSIDVFTYYEKHASSINYWIYKHQDQE